MAGDNRLWGAERIRGELLKLGTRVAKRTVQRYMRGLRSHPPGGQTWATFLRNHRHQTWARDFLQVFDLWFRPIFAFFIIDLGSRRVVHVAVTREPTSAGAAQQMRNATPFGVGPRFIIRDRDDKYGPDCVFRSTWAPVPLGLGRSFRSTWALDRSEATSGVGQVVV